MKIIFVTYYGFNDGLLGAKNALEKAGHELISYPLFQYACDVNDKKADFVDHFNTFIVSEDADIILWWCIQLSATQLGEIHDKNDDLLHIFFCWDDPFIWECNDLSQIAQKAKYFDIAFVTCDYSLPMYISNGTKESYCLYCGFDPLLYYPIDVPEYTYDVTIGLTNLYEDENGFKNQYINRKKFIDELVTMKDIKVGIYGPEHLRNTYPDNYISYVKYSDLNSMINSSKINISTHVTNKSKYINERCMLIIAAGGLLLVDPVVGNESLFISEENCVNIDKTNVTGQIRSILKNYDSYHKVKANAYKLSEQFTWDKWAIFIDSKIKNNSKIVGRQTRRRTYGNSKNTLELKGIEWSQFLSGNKILYDLEYCVTDVDLERLNTFMKQNPLADVNEIMSTYFEMRKK